MARPFELCNGKTALLVVDLQNDFVRKCALIFVAEALESIRKNQKILTLCDDHVKS